MALQSSGTISLNDVNVELGNSGTATINMGSSDVRGLFGVASGTISMSDGYGASSGNIFGSRALIAAGHSSASGGAQTDVEYFNSTTTISSATFGSMLSTYANGRPLATTNGNRALFAAGSNTTVGVGYFTVATTGNATFFGDLTYNRTTGCAVTNISRGVFISGSYTTYMDYVTIGTTGNATTFGTFYNNSFMMGAAESFAGRGVVAGGFAGTGQNRIDYITIATTGNTTSFGTLQAQTWNLSSGTNGYRAVWAGGQTPSGQNSPHSLISYTTIATTGNASTFGYLSTGPTYNAAGVSNGTNMNICGGVNSANTQLSSIGVLTVATTSNSSTVGYLTKTRSSPAGTSGT